jgi:hypothetical protein
MKIAKEHTIIATLLAFLTVLALTAQEPDKTPDTVRSIIEALEIEPSAADDEVDEKLDTPFSHDSQPDTLDDVASDPREIDLETISLIQQASTKGSGFVDAEDAVTALEAFISANDSHPIDSIDAIDKDVPTGDYVIEPLAFEKDRSSEESAEVIPGYAPIFDSKTDPLDVLRDRVRDLTERVDAIERQNTSGTAGE